jgi:hypothetical protein
MIYTGWRESGFNVQGWPTSPSMRKDSAEQSLAQRSQAMLLLTVSCGGCGGYFCCCLYSVGVVQTAKGAYLEIISSSEH